MTEGTNGSLSGWSVERSFSLQTTLGPLFWFWYFLVLFGTFGTLGFFLDFFGTLVLFGTFCFVLVLLGTFLVASLTPILATFML